MLVHGPLHTALDWGLGALRLGVLLCLSPLLLPALVLRTLGSGTASFLLRLALLPFALTYMAVKTGYHVARGAATSLLSLPYTLIMAPYRVLRFLTKSHDTGVMTVTP
ncbi:hypothetical protein CHLRE_01g020500v5 [Chlamydomonas reinhardtii]|uniref:Uncharacterized protein n=1 Tax=Chlamydomonas reinhardtii TaxID=3055 RepID=A8HPU7_CHLRE|nr:uncharacterized protein CHLRE_01g020500v5 [Chlamydomonas reinhardtii]PNW88234.1 hypothetical protein CHLRE_01g020500v5 [Chlamydomonas reinhardtii]|eukprot:XP_001689508.1 predicted protein [Chlamydomonas reinhardtii]